MCVQTVQRKPFYFHCDMADSWFTLMHDKRLIEIPISGNAAKYYAMSIIFLCRAVFRSLHPIYARYEIET